MMAAWRDVAVETAVSAGRLIKEMWQAPREITQKGARDIATDGDFAAQALIVEQIQAAFPDHGFLVEEEAGSLPSDGPIVWIVDPIDGTTNYSRQQPLFCVSMAATKPLHNGQGELTGYLPQVGVIYDPMREELFVAVAGEGVTLNGRLLEVSSVDTLEQCVLATDFPFNQRLGRSSGSLIRPWLTHLQGVRSIGTASLALAWVAAGRYDAYVNFSIKPWDIAAAWLMLHEAGGQMTNLYGEPIDWLARGIDSFASNGRIHDALLPLFARP